MNTHYFSPCIWGSEVKTMTWIGSTLFLWIIIYTIYRATIETNTINRIVCIVVVFIIGVLLLLAVLQTPKEVRVDEEKITLKSWSIGVDIPKKEVERIEHLSQGLAGMRIVGLGKFFGSSGLFHSDYCGRYISWCTNTQDVCLIYRKGKKPIAVSVEDASIFKDFAPFEEK